MEKLIQYIKKNYKKEDGAKTSQWSQGNYDDVFSDGFSAGEASALYGVAKEMGIEIEPLDEPVYD